VSRLRDIADLIDDYLRTEGGTSELERALHRERTDLGALVRRGVAAMQAMTDRHELTVAPLPAAPVVGHWDKRRLGQVLQNLLGNAIKYSPGGGSIAVTVREAPPVALVSVRDPGIGVRPEDMPLLFDRGFRAPHGAGIEDEASPGGTPAAIGLSPEGPEGNGLGLYICRQIVEAHGGRLWVESGWPAGGSTFHFSLPLGDGDED
jgi:signal transduction histidine kinase